MRYGIPALSAALLLAAITAQQAFGQFDNLIQNIDLTTSANSGVPDFTTINDVTPSINLANLPGPDTNFSVTGGPSIGTSTNVDIPAGLSLATSTASINSTTSASSFMVNIQSTGHGTEVPAPVVVANAGSDAHYTASFDVLTPTELTLSEGFLLSATPHEGPQSFMNASFVLSSTDGSASFNDQGAGEDFGSSPFAFSTEMGGPHMYNALLLPGVTYSLTADVSTSTPADNTTAGTSPDSNMNFTLAATALPEPASMTLVSGLACLLLSRRRAM